MPIDAKRSILVVEDDAVTARGLQRSLRRMGYGVLEIASSADRAIDLALEHKPDLILMDVQLDAEADGIEAAISIRSRSNIPIIFLAAYADSDTLEQSKKATPCGYILKPVRYDELRMVIELALYNHGQETRRHERERWFSTTIHSLAEAVITVDPLGKVTFMNVAAEFMTGVPIKDGVGRHITQVLQLSAPANEEADSLHTSTVEKLLERTLRDGRFAELVEARLKNLANGEELEVADTAAPIIADGHLLGAVVVLRDITERKKLQATLLISDRMASIGLLAAGVVHEINNPLAVVMGSVDAALQHVAETTTDFETGPRGPMFEMLEDIRTASMRIRDIVRDVGSFSRTEDPVLSNVDVRQVMRSTLRMADHALRLRARVETHYGAIPFVAATESQLAQVFLNLLVNASQSIPEGQIDLNCIRISMKTDENGAASIVIVDTGAGMSEATLKRLFTPFFTTKNVGAGTGLGLSICRRIIASFGGTIQIESEAGRGTTVRIVLPAALNDAGNRPSHVRATLPPSRARVMLVEDEPMVARVLERSLSSHYDVAAFGSARQALDRFAVGERYDHILCDLMMPDMNGMEFYERLSHDYPDQALRMVLITDGGLTPRVQSFLDRTQTPKLDKPFNMEALQTLLSSARAIVPVPMAAMTSAGLALVG
jgi:PAS domain S-box-containing protein